jgi:hypothetical protein
LSPHEDEAPPRFKLGLLDSKSNVVTTTLWGLIDEQ